MSKKRISGRNCKRIRILFEALEERRMLAADISAFADISPISFVNVFNTEPWLPLDANKRLTVRVFLSSPTDEEIEGVSEALAQLCDGLACDDAGEDPAEFSSWFKRLFWRVKEAATNDEVTQRLRKLERAIQIQAMELPQAEADKKLLEGVATFLEAVGDNDAVLQVGSVLLVKRKNEDGESCIVTKTLTQSQLTFLEDNPKYFKSPDEILDAISTIGHDASPIMIEFVTSELSTSPEDPPPT